MIGIFDSGSGGLSVLKALREKNKDADVVYFGDIKNIPYGNRDKKEIEQLTIAGLKILKDHGVTHIINACNSMSAAMLLSTLRILDISPESIIEMIGPTVLHMKDEKGKIGLVATKVTVDSQGYQDGFRMVGKSINIYPNKTLVEAIESGLDTDVVSPIVEKILDDVSKDKCDKLILGCTHYPLVRDIFEKVLEENGCDDSLELIDPAYFVVDQFRKDYSGKGTGQTQFILSEDSDYFRKKVVELGGLTSLSFSIV